MAVRPVEAGAPGASEVAQTVQGAHDRLSALARVAQVTGDPAGPVLEALAAQLDAEHRLFDDLKRTLAEVRRPEAVFTDKQVDEIGRRLIGASTVELVRATDRLLARRQRRFIVTVGLAAVVAAGVVSGAMWWWLQPPQTLCTDERGGRFCGVWVTQPTEAPAPQPKGPR